MIEDKTLGKYRIEYDRGIVQFKYLISHSDFINVIKPKQKELDILESVPKPGQHQLSKKVKEQLIRDIKYDLSLYPKNYFTDASPLYGAYLTGILSLPISQGGNHKCIITKIE